MVNLPVTHGLDAGAYIDETYGPSAMQLEFVNYRRNDVAVVRM